MKYICLLILIGISASLHAQVPPDAFHYSAVARDANGAPLAEKAIGIQVLLRNGSVMGPMLYEETHNVTTDLYGLFTLVIGAGIVQAGDLATIDWSADNYFLQVGLDPDGNMQYTLSNATQLLSVPYALHAGTAEKVLTPEYQSLSLSNDTLYLTDGGFVKLPPSVYTPPSLFQPEFSPVSLSNIGTNSATFQFNIGNINDHELTATSIVFSKNPNLLSQYFSFTDLSKLAGEYTMSNYTKGLKSSAEIFEGGSTYYYRVRVQTANNIYYFGEQSSFTTSPVGQAGPAGGLVFYDKGFESDGWRYMEMLPESQDSSLAWGCSGVYISEIADSVGAGLQNTALIIQNCGGTALAARYCDELVYGGYDDWYLPGAIDMNLANINLHFKGLGGFKVDKGYWTSISNGYDNARVIWFNDIPPWNYFDEPKTSQFLVRPVRRY